MKTSSLAAPVKPIPEQMAVEKGTELLTEVAIYTTLGVVGVYEYRKI
jgi:hypothetical protein